MACRPSNRPIDSISDAATSGHQTEHPPHIPAPLT